MIKPLCLRNLYHTQLGLIIIPVFMPIVNKWLPIIMQALLAPCSPLPKIDGLECIRCTLADKDVRSGPPFLNLGAVTGSSRDSESFAAFEYMLARRIEVVVANARAVSEKGQLGDFLTLVRH